MERIIQQTADGSATVSVPAMQVTYHSKHGAVQESMHVFIRNGLEFFFSCTETKTVSIFEMGFGTGLNAWLTLKYCDEHDLHINYEAIELHPLYKHEYKNLHYAVDAEELFLSLHDCRFNEAVCITEKFTLKKVQEDLAAYNTLSSFHIIYYDAFAPSAQPELWTVTMFEKLYSMLAPGGILVTYCAKGDVRRAMVAAGFEVEKLQGPPGKREMLRARKIKKPAVPAL